MPPPYGIGLASEHHRKTTPHPPAHTCLTIVSIFLETFQYVYKYLKNKNLIGKVLNNDGWHLKKSREKIYRILINMYIRINCI